MKPCEIWIEQCEATKQIEAEFGMVFSIRVSSLRTVFLSNGHVFRRMGAG